VKKAPWRKLKKMLSQTVKSLERDGLVNREAIPTLRLTVEYSITPLGRTLAATVDGLRIRAETHIDKMLKAQKQYDAGAQRAAA
jgi:DNA-binding HxlR family transcriptional regulator